MATATKTKTKTKTKSSPKPSIPTIGSGPVTNLAEALENFGIEHAAPAGSKKAARSTLTLSEEAKKAFVAFAPVKQLFDLVEAKTKILKAEANAELWKLFVKAMWETKTQPQNPSLSHSTERDITCWRGPKKCEKKKVSYEGMFIVSEKWLVNLPPVEDGQPVKPELIKILTDVLTGAGRSPKKAKESAETIVAKELILTPIISIDLTTQMFGQKIEKSFVNAPEGSAKEAATAIFQSKLQGQGVTLSVEQLRALQFTVKQQANVMPSFLQRVCSYVGSVEELTALLAVITPQFHIKGAKVTDIDEEDKVSILIECAEDIVTT